MARAIKRVKTGRESTAAYAASQPLFDALRFAVDRINEQHAHLSNARDIVQQTHIKLADSLSDGDISQHTRYMDSITKAWRSANASYVEIFNALAKASAAEPSEGKPQREGHETFVKMASIATEAGNVAEAFDRYEEHQNEAPKSATRSERTQNEDASNVSEDLSEQEEATSMQMDVVRPAEQVKEATKQAKYRKRVEDARQKHEKKMLALRAKKKSVRGASNPAEERKPSQVRVHVEYEDVSAEVEARLKAKQAKKEAAKKEKKRKRESGDSNGLSAVSVEKPAKKRSRSTSIGKDNTAVAAKEKLGERRNAAGEGDSGRQKKKVKLKS